MGWRLLVLGIVLLFSFPTYSQKSFAEDTAYAAFLNKKASDAFNTDVDSILFYAQKALTIANKINYYKGASVAYANLGDYYSFKGQHEMAIEYFENSRRTAIKSNFTSGVATAILGRGVVYFNIGDNVKAMQSYYEALKIYEAKSYYNGIASCYNNLGVLYRNERQYDEAIAAFKSVIEAHTRTGKKVSIAGAYANIGTVYQARKDYLNALHYGRKAYRMFDSLKIPRGLIISLNNLGDAHVSIDSIDLAISEFNKSIEIGKAHGFESNAVSSLTGLAYASSKKKKLSEAIGYINNAITIAQKKRMKSQLITLYDTLGNMCLKAKSYQQAANAFRRSIDLKDSVNSIESLKSINNLTIKYQVDKKEAEIKLLQEERRVANLNRNIYISIPAIAMLIIFLLYRQQLIKNRKDNQLMRQKEELMRIHYKSNITEGKLIALRAQLNPHFIFNCLNSINSFILKADPKSSSEMLLKFAKLVRLILEQSDKKMIPFTEEIKLMNLYIDLEKNRSNDMFNLTLQVDQNIESESMMVPSLIAQPFVENAVIHAFTEKKEANRITVRYFKEGQSLFCSIEDNGIGRQKSSKNKSPEKNKSLGISISEQRIRLIDSAHENENPITIEDLYDASGQPIGTKVLVKIPFSEA